MILLDYINYQIIKTAINKIIYRLTEGENQNENTDQIALH